MWYGFVQTLKRDLTIAYRHRMEYLNPLFFFVLITMLFPLAITPEPKMLTLLGPGVIWIGLLFSILLSIDTVFLSDYEDGTLEQMVLHSDSLSIQILAKLVAYWVVSSAPLLAATILVSQLFFLKAQLVVVLLLSLLLGSMTLTFLAAIGAALTLGLANRSLLLVLIILPLYLPVVIFGAGAVNAASQGLSPATPLCFLAAFLSLTLTFSPITIAATLKISLE